MDLSETEDEIPRRKRRAAAQRVNYAKLRFDYEHEPSFECSECHMTFDTKRGLSAHNMHKHKSRTSNLTRSSNRRQKRRVYSEEEDEEEEIEEEELEDEEVQYLPPKKRAHRERSSSPPIEELIKPKIVKTPKPKRVVGSLVGFEQEAEEENEPNAQDLSAEEADDLELAEGQEHQQEVENFPCKLCREDRVFLTSFGLERHTKISHPDKLEEVLEDIKHLQMEKLKKSEARKTARGQTVGGSVKSQNARDQNRGSFSAFFENKELERRRKAAGKSTRRFGNAFDKEKENDPDYDPSDSNSGAVIQMVRQQRAAIVASASFTEPKMTGGRHKKSLDAPKAKYQSCDICGILINTEHPRAMESHTKAHQKNQELRDELMRLYGPSWVDNVTCKECNLVFKDDEKLEQHRRNVHVRRRHFLCRFCGDVFRNMRDLNLHKERRHEAFEGHRRHTYESVEPSASDFYANDSSNRSAASSSVVNADHSTISSSGIVTSSAQNSTSRPPSRSQPAVADAGNAEEFSCRTVCEVCGLQMVRPSNLIRHMKQAHDRTNFTATVDTKGMPPFRIDVFQGQFMWGCCDEIYDDRQAFISHRRSAHGPQSNSGMLRECEHCGLVFNNNLLYVNHLRIHRPRICYICGESFGSSVDANSYKAHMLKHKEQGYNISLCQISDDWLRKESERGATSEPRFATLGDQAESDLLDDFALPDDQYSVFSESGVESDCDDANSLCDEKDDAKLFTLCPVCDKRFDCVYRFGEHWALHCVKPIFSSMQFKTKPFSFKNHVLRHFYCSICPSKFCSRVSLALHFLNCRQRKLLGLSQKAENPETSSSETNEKGETAENEKEQEQNIETESKRNSSLSLTADDRSSPMLVSVTDSADCESAIRKCEDSHELEDCLDVKQNKRYNNYMEKAYIIEWDTNKIAPDYNPYLCCTCDRSFGDFLGLIAHVKTHVEHPIYAEIEENPSVSTSSKNDPAEKSVAEKENEMAESASGEELVRAFVLSIKTGSSLIGPLKYSCSICSKKFEDKNLFEEHFHLNHKNRKRHLCDACGKRFWTRSGLKMHVEVHDESKHYCSICEKKFVNADSLSKHQMVHELVNSVYQCEDCIQSLYGLSQLKEHFVKSHPGIRIVTCSVCARIHTDAEGVEEHFNAEHSRTRSFCALCMKCFKTPMKCKRHVKRAHRKFLPCANK